MIGWSGWKSMVQSAAQTVANLVGQDIVARSISLTQTATNIAVQLVTGARLKLGAGTTDYLTSNGTTTITAAGAFTATSLLTAGAGLTVTTSGINMSLAGGYLSFNGTTQGGIITTSIAAASAGATAATAAHRIYSDNALDAGDWVVSVGNGANAASLFAIRYDGSIVQSTAGDSTGAPGNATLNTPSGRSAFAGAASTCVITNSLVTASSQVYAALQTADGTLTSILRVVPGAGTFTVTGNAAATGTTNFCWFVVNPS